MTRNTGLTAKQQAFVDEYAVDLNATQAAIRAGYSKSNADKIGPELLGKTRVAAAVQAALAERRERVQLKADNVLRELARIAFFDIRSLYHDDGRLKLPSELDEDEAHVLQGIDVAQTGGGDSPLVTTKKVRVADKMAALQLAMRHLGMLKDKVEHSGKVDGPPPFIVEVYHDADAPA